MKEWEYILAQNLGMYKGALYMLREAEPTEYNGPEETQINLVRQALVELRDDAQKRLGECDAD